ncbi:DUF4058 family protein [Floridanema aerugineum]|uniref:DUF4058 family protein n=1 Tax=Floridaenema aerugineum BLCC-F46 TaxID=3153654 RepID=A0ABV4X7V7_9CYAN
MPSPFPGMNPYLENPLLWSEVHHRLISAIAPNLSLQYRVAIEKRTYLSEGEESVMIGGSFTKTITFNSWLVGNCFKISSGKSIFP